MPKDTLFESHPHLLPAGTLRRNIKHFPRKSSIASISRYRRLTASTFILILYVLFYSRVLGPFGVTARGTICTELYNKCSGVLSNYGMNIAVKNIRTSTVRRAACFTSNSGCSVLVVISVNIYSRYVEGHFS